MLNPASRISPTSPEKELRFTRSHQANGFAVVAAVALAATVTLGINQWQASADGMAPWVAWWWMVPLALVATACIWAAVFLTVHAYILLTPLGIEVFPFWRPTKNFRIIHWSEIAGIRVNDPDNHVTIDLGTGGGAVISLAPITQRSRQLLVRALTGRTMRGNA